MKISPSALACSGMGVPLPPAVPSAGGEVCAFCGVEIAEGEPMTIEAPGPNFTDGALLMARKIGRRGYTSCAACSAVMRKGVMGKTCALMATRSAAWSTNKNTALKWVLENLPSVAPAGEPFVFTRSIASNPKHIIWSAPVSRSPSMFRVAIAPGTSISVNMTLARRAAEIVMSAVRRDNPACGASSILYAPSKLYASSWGFGQVRAGLLNATDEAFLRSLGPGELWACSILASTDTPEPAPFRFNHTA